MNNLNPSELENLAQLKNKRKARFDKMGITPLNQINESNSSEFEQKAMLASASPTGRDRLANIRNIQSGALKSEMRNFNSAESPNDSFQEIPVNLPKRPQTPEDRQKKSEDMKSLGLDKKAPAVKGSSQAAAYEAMFDTDSGGYASANDVVMGHDYDKRLSESQTTQQGGLINENQMMGGIGNWQNEFKNRTQQYHTGNPSQVNQGQANNHASVNQHSMQQNHALINEQSQVIGGVGPTQINQMIEQKASEIVDIKMREILSEFSQEFNSFNKKPLLKEGQLLAEKVKAKSGKFYKDLVKIGGKFYKLQEVNLK